MYRFNENNIVTGYIKELLYNFNLPKCKVYKKGKTELYADTNYIHNNQVILVESVEEENCFDLDKTKWRYVHSYGFGDYFENLTKNLVLNNINYDYYTHNYLGDYLRFYRDFTGVDLMPFYNCFSNQIVDNIRLESFDTDNTLYKIYMLPVKFNQTYLIGLDSEQKVEVCCGLYDNEQVTTVSNSVITSLYKETYKSYSHLQMNNPQLFSTYISVDSNLIGYERCLKMFIKLPIQNNSTISIIELDNKPNVYNSNVKGKVSDIVLTDEEMNYPTKLSLFKINDGTQYPFSDRLVEYLFGNVIDSEDIIGENIEWVQKQLLSTKQKLLNNSYTYKLDTYGVWDSNIKKCCYSSAKGKIVIPDKDNVKRFIDTKYDINGFIDKDIEKLIQVIDE